MLRQHLHEGSGKSYEYRVDGGWVLFKRLDHLPNMGSAFAEYTFTDMVDYITFHVYLDAGEYVFRLSRVIRNDLQLAHDVDFEKIEDVFRKMTPTNINAMSTIWNQ